MNNRDATGRWDELRAQFAVTQSYIYLNHAAVSPLPLRCRQGMEAYLDELCTQGAAGYPKAMAATVARARTLGATLMGAAPEQVFVVRSTTQGLGLVATGLPVGAGDNVVIVEREFPANVRPWLPLRRRGVDVRLVPQRGGRVELDDLARAVDRHTAAVSVSFVQFLSGFRIDLAAVAELCRRHDALCVVDAIQGLGVFPLDVARLGIDFLSADAHKWMLGPEGVGLGYASPRAMERIQPALEGWLAVSDPFAFFDLDQPLKADAGRFHDGAQNRAGLHGMIGSLELLLEHGVAAIGERILQLTDHLVQLLQRQGWQVLSPRDTPEEKSGIVLTTREGAEMDQLAQRLRAEHVVFSLRDGALRLSPHAYNTEQELEQVVQLLR